MAILARRDDVGAQGLGRAIQEMRAFEARVAAWVWIDSICSFPSLCPPPLFASLCRLPVFPFFRLLPSLSASPPTFSPLPLLYRLHLHRHPLGPSSFIRRQSSLASVTPVQVARANTKSPSVGLTPCAAPSPRLTLHTVSHPLPCLPGAATHTKRPAHTRIQ